MKILNDIKNKGEGEKTIVFSQVSESDSGREEEFVERSTVLTCVGTPSTPLSL